MLEGQRHAVLVSSIYASQGSNWLKLRLTWSSKSSKREVHVRESHKVLIRTWIDSSGSVLLIRTGTLNLSISNIYTPELPREAAHASDELTLFLFSFSRHQGVPNRVVRRVTGHPEDAAR